MSEAVATASPAAARRWRIPLWLDILVTAALALLLARAIYLPQARPLDSEDALTAPAGQWLVLDGLAAGTVLELAAEAPGEVRFSAPSASLDAASRTYLQSVGVPTAPASGPVQWAASAAGGQMATLVTDLVVGESDARLALNVVEGEGLKLRVERGTLAVSVRLDSDGPARALLQAPGSGGTQAYGPGHPIAFTVSGGGSHAATLNVGVNQQTPIRLLHDDGSEGPLPLTGLEVDAHRDALSRTCGGADRAIALWPALLQLRTRPIPGLSNCEPGRMKLGSLVLQPNGVVAHPTGTAYVPGELPALSSLKENPAVGPLLAAVLGYPAARLAKEWPRLWARILGKRSSTETPDNTKA
ncbi:MAG: hypothetical protein JO111_13620 [Caulobacteraceae bacterium]|nr:hypothetical protein [Caulobacteraceae bacterium]